MATTIRRPLAAAGTSVLIVDGTEQCLMRRAGVISYVGKACQHQERPGECLKHQHSIVSIPDVLHRSNAFWEAEFVNSLHALLVERLAIEFG